MDPLTPNTSAFLSYLSSGLEDGSIDTSYDPLANVTPSSFPPSAFFPMPGRDTPEDTPPSSVEASQSPEKSGDVNRLRTDSTATGSGTEAAGTKAGKKGKKATDGGIHKRKAGAGQHKNDEEVEDEDDTASDFTDGHEDKRQHQNKSGAGKKGARKSVGSTAGDEGGPKEKAARRKEQNRAAQKAFRERREAKVKDLEDQVAELERKAYGTTVENENLRGILKRLQEENVALRQSAFTFSMPVNGSPTNGSGTRTPTLPGAKPPTPPHQNSADDVLRSIDDSPPLQALQHPPQRASSLNQESPDSLVSVASGASSSSGANSAPINLFGVGGTPFDPSTMTTQRPAAGHTDSSGSNTGTTSTAPSEIQSLSPGDRTELDALWASFLAPAGQPAWNTEGPSPFSLINAQPQSMSFANGDAKIGTQTTNDWDKFAFRDPSAALDPQQPEPVAQQPQQPQQMQQSQQQPGWAPQADPWAGMLDNGIDDFLASLSGSNNAVQEKEQPDEDFNAQIQQILGNNNSPSDPFNLPANPFSPTNYLNMSPVPTSNGSNASNGPSPQTFSSASNSASPESTAPLACLAQHDPSRPGYGTLGPAKPESEHIYVVDDAGKIVKPSDLWVKMGMQHESNLEHLLIDDLCDMMRSKATCKDGKAYLSVSDAEKLFKYPSHDPVHDKRVLGLAERAGIKDPHAFLDQQQR